MRKLFLDWITVWDVPFQADITCVRKYLRMPQSWHRFDWDGLVRKGCYHNTPRGRVAHWDGELIVDNPRFVKRSQMFTLADTELRVDDLRLQPEEKNEHRKSPPPPRSAPAPL